MAGNIENIKLKNKPNWAKYSREYRLRNLDKERARKKRYYEANKEYILKRDSEYRKANPEKTKEIIRKYKNKNSAKIKISRKKYLIENADKISIQRKQYREKNKDKIKESRKIHSKLNSKKISEYGKKWRQQNRLKHNKTRRKYIENNRQKIRVVQNDYKKRKFHTDLNFRIQNYIRNRVNFFIKKKSVKQTKTKELLGCSIEELKVYLESKFSTEMNWENRGKLWHIDHKIPCAAWDLSKAEAQKKCFHYTNLQPLPAKINVSKKDKVDLDEIKRMDIQTRNLLTGKWKVAVQKLEYGG